MGSFTQFTDGRMQAEATGYSNKPSGGNQSWVQLRTYRNNNQKRAFIRNRSNVAHTMFGKAFWSDED